MKSPGLSTVTGALAAAAAVLVLFAGSEPAAADHPAIPSTPGGDDGLFRNGTFPAGRTKVLWFFESRWPGKKNAASKHKSAVLRGARTWNYEERTLEFVDGGHREIPWHVPWDQIAKETNPAHTKYCALKKDNPRTKPYDEELVSIVFWTKFTPGPELEAVARATNCHDKNSGRPTKFYMAFDRTKSWNTSASWDQKLGFIDLEGVATHEFGHAGGWQWHYDDYLDHDDDGIKDQGWESPGTADCDRESYDIETMCSMSTRGDLPILRSLETHDRATWAKAYPAR